MTHRKTLSIALAVALAGMSASAATAQGKSSFAADLSGYQEALMTINSTGSGNSRPRWETTKRRSTGS